MNHIIAVLGSERLNIASGIYEFTMKIEISQEVFEWLESHDVEYTDGREKVYICNNLKYIYVGPKPDIIPMANTGKA